MKKDSLPGVEEEDYEKNLWREEKEMRNAWGVLCSRGKKKMRVEKNFMTIRYGKHEGKKNNQRKESSNTHMAYKGIFYPTISLW